jgi:hypothetical protein
MTDDKYKALQDAAIARDVAVRDLVVEEIRAMIPAVAEREDTAAGELREACDALAKPSADLAALEAEIAQVRSKCGEWAEGTYSGDPAVRVNSRDEFRKWDEELSRLEERHQVLEQDVAQLQVRKNKAAEVLENARLEKGALELNACKEMAFYAAGTMTEAYKTFRFGWCDLAIVLRPGNDSHPEHDEAIRWLEQIAYWSGYKLVRDTKDDQWRQMWDQVYADANPPEPAPSGQGVMREDFDALGRAIIREQDQRWNRPAR